MTVNRFSVALISIAVVLVVAEDVLAQERSAPDIRQKVLPLADTSADIKTKILESKRLVFLGDSNTDVGEYIVQFEAAMLDEFGRAPEMINLGLASETCSGLTEPIHPFPRPCVLERLDRVLVKTRPEIVIACYGMNDAIYHPLSASRFAAYQSGMQQLIEKVNGSGAQLILLTPPPFDPLPQRLAGKLVPARAPEFSWKTIYEAYDTEVIQQYADWVMQQRDQVWAVVDTHGPLNSYLEEKRKSDSGFAFSNDGVHFDVAGHQVFAQCLLRSLGFTRGLSENELLVKLVRQRQSLAHPAWLSEVGHLRPGVAVGLSMEAAAEKIEPLSRAIAATLLRSER